MNAAIDLLIIVAYFAAIVTIGLRVGRRDDSLREFALGGRRVPWWAVMASIIAAEVSAATFLGTPGEGFATGSLVYVQLTIGVILGRLVVAWLFIGPYYRFGVYTVYDYLGIRFGPLSKATVSALFLFFRTLASGARLFIPALLIVLAWKTLAGGESVQYKVVPNLAPYAIAIALLMLATCLYTAAGGIKAVIWTDVIQASLMFGSALVAIVVLLHQLGGNAWDFAAIGANLQRFAPKLSTVDGYFTTGFDGGGHWLKTLLANPYTLPAAIIGSSVTNMAAFGTDQDMVQRLLTSKTAGAARRSLMTAAVVDVPIAAAFTFIGILLFAYFSIEPTHLPIGADGKASSANVFGAYILNVMPVGVRGLVLAGVFATAMGSLSAALNALATTATNDWYLRFRPNADERSQLFAARLATVAFAVLMTLVAVGFAQATLVNPSIRLIPLVLGIANYLLGPMLGIFLLGVLTKTRGSDRGNLVAVAVGLLVTSVLGKLHIDLANFAATTLGSPTQYAAPKDFPQIAFTWFALIGASVVFAVGVCFRTPSEAIERARRALEAASHDDRPIEQRGGA